MISETLSHSNDTSAWPTTHMVREHSEVIIIGDFLDQIVDLTEWLDGLAESGARAHLVQVLDPIGRNVSLQWTDGIHRS